MMIDVTEMYIYRANFVFDISIPDILRHPQLFSPEFCTKDIFPFNFYIRVWNLSSADYDYF